MKFFALLSLIISASTFASIPHNVCADQFGIGTPNYQKCINGEFDKPMSIPLNVCAKEFGIGTPDYQKCVEGQFNEPAPFSVPVSLCRRLIPNMAAYKACMNGDFDAPTEFSVLDDCLKACAQQPDHEACMEEVCSQEVEALNLNEDCSQYVLPAQETEYYQCLERNGEIGPFI